MKRVVVFFVVLVTALAAVLYFRLRDQRLEAARPSGGSATIEGTEVDVVARIPARIAAVRVREGDTVHAGDPLVELECSEPRAALAQADASVGAAQAALEAAKVSVDLARHSITTAERQALAADATARATRAQRLALEVQHAAAKRAEGRVERLASAGVASEQVLDQSQSQASALRRQIQAVAVSAQAAEAQAAVAATSPDTAAIQVRAAEAQVHAAQQQIAAAEAARARAAVSVGECVLVAPLDGYVQTRSYEPGEAVLPGSRILSIVDTREVKAIFYLPNAELGAAAPGQKVSVVPDAYPERTFEGAIRRVAVTAEFTPRNVQTREDRDRLVYAVEVRIPNQDGTLRPGMPVEVTIPGTGRGAL